MHFLLNTKTWDENGCLFFVRQNFINFHRFIVILQARLRNSQESFILHKAIQFLNMWVKTSTECVNFQLGYGLSLSHTTKSCPREQVQILSHIWTVVSVSLSHISLFMSNFAIRSLSHMIVSGLSLSLCHKSFHVKFCNQKSVSLDRKSVV